ncbi:MAG: zf-HC2 domain-containing protein [Pseudomonadota bacterium]
MMRLTTHRNDHDELAPKLPWFVNRTLDADEHAKVERHIEDCAECRDELALLALVQTSLAHDVPTPIVSKSRIDALQRHIVENTAEPLRAPRRRYYWLSAAAAVAALALAFVAAGRWFAEPSGADFRTVTSGGAAAPMDYVFAIRFAEGVGGAERQAVFDAIGAGKVSSAGGLIYEATVRLPAGSLEDLERFSESLEARRPVAAVEIVALRLPVTSSP